MTLIDPTTGLPALPEGQCWEVVALPGVFEGALRLQLTGERTVTVKKTVVEELPKKWYQLVPAKDTRTATTDKVERYIIEFENLYETTDLRAGDTLEGEGWEYQEPLYTMYAGPLGDTYHLAPKQDPTVMRFHRPFPYTDETILNAALKIMKRREDQEEASKRKAETKAAATRLVGVYPPKTLEGIK